MIKEKVLKIFQGLGDKKGRTIGAIIGLIIGIFILIIGFFRTLFIGICTWLGYYIGKISDDRESFNDILKKVMPHNRGN
ncbi:MAG TPA: DUF2273 domain-containing protein [Tissierellales bacterium]|nr:DUF2273 domain-containing protein [Tissierellales bacterium]